MNFKNIFLVISTIIIIGRQVVATIQTAMQPQIEQVLLET